MSTQKAAYTDTDRIRWFARHYMNRHPELLDEAIAQAGLTEVSVAQAAEIWLAYFRTWVDDQIAAPRE